MNGHPSHSLILATVLLAITPLTAEAQATFEDQVMEIVNQERWNNGNLAPLKRNAALDLSSETHSAGMADRNFFAHCDPDNQSLPWDRMTAAGYTGWNSAAENIAAGYATPALVMTGWMNSSGHRANILSTNYREVGIGYVNAAADANNIRQDPNGDCTPDGAQIGPFYRYWTQNFGRINTVYPVVINREAWQATNSTVNLYVYGTGFAQEMRFRNEAGIWSAWQPYATNTTWVLSPGNGTKTVNCELRSGATVRTASDQIQLNASADVAVALVDLSDPVTLGTNLTWQVTVTNNGTSTATGIQVTDVLPANVTFVSTTAQYALNAGTLVCTVPSLAPGAGHTFTVEVLAVSGSSVSNSVSVQASEFDPAAGNNQDTESTNFSTPSAAGDAPPPVTVALRTGRPNPFRTTTVMSYDLPADGHVLLTIHDAAGRVVTTLVDVPQPAGRHEAAWDGRDSGGRPLPAGVYFGRMEAEGQVRSTKLILMR